MAILDNMSPPELIAQYVLECRGSGLVLPYDDYRIIEEWLRALPDAKQLLLILSDWLPQYFAKPKASSRTRNIPKSLARARDPILERIATLNKHTNF